MDVDGRNLARKPVEGWPGFFYIPGDFLAGFLNHQQHFTKPHGNNRLAFFHQQTSFGDFYAWSLGPSGWKSWRFFVGGIPFKNHAWVIPYLPTLNQGFGHLPPKASSTKMSLKKKCHLLLNDFHNSSNFLKLFIFLGPKDTHENLLELLHAWYLKHLACFFCWCISWTSPSSCKRSSHCSWREGSEGWPKNLTRIALEIVTIKLLRQE